MVFGLGGGASNFQTPQLDVTLLSGLYKARTALRLSNHGTATAALMSGTNREDAIATPWDRPEDDRGLERQINEIRKIRSFIDPKSEDVKLAGDNRDVKALFTLYQALAKLKTIADYAAQSSVGDASRGPLDVLLQKGLAEVRDFIASAQLDKLDLLAGAKSNRVETQVGLGRNATKVVGQVIHRKERDAPIPGIVGNEVFTVSISKYGTTEDVAIDLAEIAGPITLDALANHINEKLAAFQAVDTDGEPVFDSEGNPVPRYSTRFNVEAVEGGGFALALSGLTGEQVSLSAAAPDPALFLVGTSRPAGNGEQSSGLLQRLDGIDGASPTSGLRQTIAGTGTGLKEVPDESDKTDPLNGRSNAVVEQIRKDMADLFKELEIGNDEGDGLTRTGVETSASKVAVDSAGHLYVIGQTAGDLGRELNRSDGGDVFLTKYDAAGNLLWQRLLGASGTAEGFSLAINSGDNVIVAGAVDGTLTGKELFAGKDSFVAKFSGDGSELWTRQLDTNAEDGAFAVTVDADDNIYLAGGVAGRLTASASHGGATDGYVAKIDGGTGAVAGITQFGGAGEETAKAIAMAADGHLLVASEEDGRAILRKLDRDDPSQVLWATDLGDLGAGAITGIAVEGGNIYLAGHSDNGGFGAGVRNAHSGSQDGFVIRVDDLGAAASAVWTSFIGDTAGDYIQDITVSGGAVYVAGRTTGELGAQERLGITEAFAAKLDGVDGSQGWIRQFAAAGHNAAQGLAFSSNGQSVLTRLGLGPGSIHVSEPRDVISQTTVRAGDHFYISVNGRTKQRVTIQEGDTFEKIAARINRLSLSYIKAEVSFTGDGRKLRISTKNGGEVQIFAGDGDRDALRGLGLEATKILPNERLFVLNDDKVEGELGGAFALNLEKGLSVASERAAKYLAGSLSDALANIQRAYRSLFPDPLAEMLKQQAQMAKGTVPPALQKQLANYEAGFNRLMAGSGGFSV